MSNTGVHRDHHGPALGLRTFVGVVVCIMLIAADQRRVFGERPRAALMAAVYPLQTIAAMPTSLFNWSEDATRSRADLARENVRLKRERLLADARLQQLNAVRAENDRLRTMLDARPRAGEDITVAQLLDIDNDPFRHRVTINKGASNGVFRQQAIVDANGVVGQVIHVGPSSAQVMLVSDPGHAIQVEVVRNGLRTVAFGAGEYDQLEIRFLPNNADIVVGDLLVTTSLGGDYPAGYPVGEVTAVQTQPRQAFAKVTAKPAAALTRMREVLLLTAQISAEDDADEDNEPDPENSGNGS
ncbi:MAG: rod shape-determining protein MreC [Pseudomonadota bacterium]